METLPTELLHRIFDHLNVETIFFTLRSLSKLFRAVVTSYDRYILNMKLISKSNFYILCQLIKPQNVISLILANDERISNQIDLFISLVHCQQFTRLRSLTLLKIDDIQLNFILKRINPTLLTSFSFSIRKSNDLRIKTTYKVLTSTFIQLNLRQLEFDMENTILSKFSWPFDCTIQYLTINNNITMDNLITILQRTPHLHTIIIKNFDEYCNSINSTSFSLLCFSQLRSLTIEQLNVPFFQVETFLLLTPSLHYLKLIGSKILNGQRCEQFIQMNLCKLEKFEFFCNEWFSNSNTVKDLESIISSFRSSFWIEHKQWFVTGEYDTDCSYNIRLYSIPLCKTSLKYEPELGKVSLSTCDKSMKNKLTVMNNVKSLTLTLNKLTVDDIQKKNFTTNYSLFPKVSEIEIIFYSDCSLFSLHSFSIFINIIKIVQMKLESDFFNEYNKDTFINIGLFLTQAHNLSSLYITNNSNERILCKTVQNIYQLLPHQLKHLQMPISNSNQIKNILQKCEKLSTIKFDIESKISENIIQWFNDNTINSTCKQDSRTITIWLGKKTVSQNIIRIYNTRKKFKYSH